MEFVSARMPGKVMQGFQILLVTLQTTLRHVRILSISNTAPLRLSEEKNDGRLKRVFSFC